MMTAVVDTDWCWGTANLPIGGDHEAWSVEEGLADLEEMGLLHPICPAQPPAKRRKGIATIAITTTAKNNSIPMLALPKPRKPAPTTPGRKSTKKTKSISSHIPFEIWLEIFSYCQPSQLARLRRVNSSFRAFIDDEKLWAKSRRNTFPSHPEPMYGFQENCMWNLWKGSGCELCGAPRFKKCYWTWGIRLCTNCFKEHRVRGDEIAGERDFVNSALVCLRHCFVSGKFVSTQRGNYYGLGGGDPCYWKDEVTAFRAIYLKKQDQDPKQLATFLEFEKEKVRVQMETAVKMCEFERHEATARREEIAEIRRQRLISIPEKCKQYFTPQIPDGVLEHIPSYQAALRAGSRLTERGWKTLVTRIASERAKAEAKYQERQEAKESAHRKYTKIRQKARKHELREHSNLLRLRGAMAELVKLAREFIKKEAGHLLLDHTRAQSFVLETMKFCRRRWYEKNEGQKLPFRALYFLWEEVLEGAVGNFKEAGFCCEYCRKIGTWEEIVFHLASEHHKEPGMAGLARNPVEFAADEKVILKRTIPNWDGVEWPEKIPVLSTGPKFTPRNLKDRTPRPSLSTCSSTTITSNKPRKPRKPGTSREDPICMFSVGSSLSAKFPKPQTTPRILISRIIVEVSELRVPPFFQLSLFFRKMVADFKRYKLRVEFNELLYELIRICDQDRKAPAWFSHEALVCNACMHTWDGAQSIVTLMLHFFQFHHPNSDWRKDMLLMPGPPDVLAMLRTVNDRRIEYRWDQEAEEYALDAASARSKQALADGRGEVLCPIEELKAQQLVKREQEGEDKRLQVMMSADMFPGGFERKRKREEDEGKGKGKERDDTLYDTFSASDTGEDEGWEDTFDVEELSDCGTLDHCALDMPAWLGVDVEMEG